MKRIQAIISVGKSKSLLNAVLSLLDKESYPDMEDETMSGSMHRMKVAMKEDRYSSFYLYLSESGQIAWDWMGTVTSPPWGSRKIDAATEFGKLVELLEAPPEIIIRGVGSYDAVVKSDKSGVQIGCQFASKATVQQVWDAFVGRKDSGLTAIIGVKSEKLFDITASMLKDAGITELPNYGPADNFPFDGREFGYRVTGGRYVNHGPGIAAFDATGYPDHPRIHADTEMGKLIELLEGNVEQNIKIELIDKRGVKYEIATVKNDSLTIAGKIITKKKVEEIWNALQDKA